MERLTRNSAAGKYVPSFEGVMASVKDYHKCVDRLGRIEDILGDTYDLDRLRELVVADKEGKSFISPCKIGDTVYILHNGKYPHLNSATVSGVHLRDETYLGGKKRREYIVVRKNGFSKHLPIDRIGKMWFLDETAAKSSLAAEAALAKEVDHE